MQAKANLYIRSTDPNDINVSWLIYAFDPQFPTPNVYHAEIDAVFNAGTAPSQQDRYTVIWYRNGVPLNNSSAAVVTNPKITVRQRSNGATLFTDQTMGEYLTGTGIFHYSPAAQIALNDAAIVTAKATIDGQTRDFTRIINRVI